MHDVMCGRNVFDEHMQRVSTDEHSEASIASPTQLLYGALLAFCGIQAIPTRDTYSACRDGCCLHTAEPKKGQEQNAVHRHGERR